MKIEKSGGDTPVSLGGLGKGILSHEELQENYSLVMKERMALIERLRAMDLVIQIMTKKIEVKENGEGKEKA